VTPEIVSYAGLLIAIVGIPFAFFVARYYASRPRIEYALSHEKIFDVEESKVSGPLSIQYADESLNNLHRWKIAIWNSGNRPFDEDSFIASDPLELRIDGHRILDVQERRSSRNAVRPIFAVGDDQRALKPSFEICDSGDGFVFFVFSERVVSLGSATTDLACAKFSGSLKGLPQGMKRSMSPSKLSLADGSLILGFIVVLSALGPLVSWDFGTNFYSYLQGGEYSYFAAKDEERIWHILSWPLGIIVTMIGLLAGVLGLVLMWAFAQEFLKFPSVVKEGFFSDSEGVTDPD